MALNRKALNELYEVVKNRPAERFDMGTFCESSEPMCKTVCCAIGSYVLSPDSLEKKAELAHKLGMNLDVYINRGSASYKVDDDWGANTSKKWQEYFGFKQKKTAEYLFGYEPDGMMYEGTIKGTKGKKEFLKNLKIILEKGEKEFLKKVDAKVDELYARP